MFFVSILNGGGGGGRGGLVISQRIEASCSHLVVPSSLPHHFIPFLTHSSLMTMMVVTMMNIWCLMILMADSCRMVPPFMLLPMLLCSPPSSPTIRNQYLINLPQPTSPNHPLWNILDFLKFAAERDFFRIVFCSGYPDCDFRECAKSAR